MPINYIQVGPDTGFLADVHFVPRLLAALTQPKTDASPFFLLDPQAFVEAIDHLHRCEDCRAEIAVMQAMGDIRSGLLAALLAHVQQAGPNQAPSASDLAAFSQLAHQVGRRAASTQMPEIGRHVRSCPLCREDVGEALALLRAVMPRPRRTTSTTSPAKRSSRHNPTARSPWIQTRDGLWRLRRTVTIQIGRQLVQVSTPLRAVSVSTTYQGKRRWLSSSARGVADMPEDGIAQQEQGFTIDLRDSASSPREHEGPHEQRWLRVQVLLRATYAKRISGELQTTWVASTDDLEAVAPDVTWRIESARATDTTTTPEYTPTGHAQRWTGSTDAEGIARFFIGRMGTYQLRVTTAGREWSIPLEFVDIGVQ